MGKAVVPSSIVSEVLEKDNYEDWSETIRAYLEFKDLWDVVESNEQPIHREADEATFKAWNKNNSKALHAIKISCGRQFLSMIRGIREANKAWRTLQEHFNPPLPKRMDPQQGDLENVDNDCKAESLVDAFSRRDISYAIQLCKKNPALLNERLPNYTPLLHQLIMLISGRREEDEVVEMLKLDHFPKEALEMTDSFGRTPLIAAVLGEAIQIARCLVEMNPTLISIPDAFRLIPLAVAIEFFNNDMADMLCSFTSLDGLTLGNAEYGATVITKCFEARELEFASKLLKKHPHLTFAKDVNGISPLYAAARAPDIFCTRRYCTKFSKFISNMFRHLWLPIHSQDIEISVIELLIAMRNAIKGSNMISRLLRDAFFEAIKCGNFNFIVMLINCDKNILEEVNDMWKNIYMCAIEYRQAKVFSLIFWDKKDRKDRKKYANVWQDKCKNNLLHMAATWTPNALGRISKPTVQMTTEVKWFAEVSKLAPHLKTKSNVAGKTPNELFKESHEDLMMEAEKEMKKSVNSWSIVGPLIISIMFAGAFQIPGGYNQEMGLPIFINEMHFKFYMVTVSISILSAMGSVMTFLKMISSKYKEKDFETSLMNHNTITLTLFLSIEAMLVAFLFGISLTTKDRIIVLPVGVIVFCLVTIKLCTMLDVVVETFRFHITGASLFVKNPTDEVERIFKMLNRQPIEEVRQRRWQHRS